jgi:hypothetical protein
MLCAIEIGMLIVGIMALSRGEVRLGQNWSIRGLPAYAIGAILTATLPLIAAIGFISGFMMGLTGNEKALPMLAMVDLGGVALSAVSCLIIAALSPNADNAEPEVPASSTPYVPPFISQPMDPANRYATPSYFGDEQRR